MNHHHHQSAGKPVKEGRTMHFIGAAVIFGLFAFFFSLLMVDVVQGWRMRDWSYAEATLVDRSLTPVNRSEGRWYPGMNYRANYLYSYEWQGHTYYTQDQAFFNMSGSDVKFWEFR